MPRAAYVALTLSLALGTLLAACNDDTTDGPATQAPPSATATQAATSVPTPIPTVEGVPTVMPSGLQIIDIVAGTGAEAKLGDTITVQYTGYLEDGTVFDGPEIHGEPIQFQLAVGSLIQGWTDGIPGMKVGGKRRLIIPPELGYGASGRGQIPPNATLTFDVELVSIP